MLVQVFHTIMRNQDFRWGKKCQCGTRGVDVKNVVMVACTVIFTKEIIKEESIRVTLLEQKISVSLLKS